MNSSALPHEFANAVELRSLTESLSLLEMLANGTRRAVGEEYLRSLVQHLSQALGVDCVLLGRLIQQEPEVVRTVAVWFRGQLVDNFDYPLRGTPCERVVQRSLCTFPDHVHELFPDDIWLAQNGMRSYMGLPVRGTGDKVLGILAAVHSAPKHHDAIQAAVIRLFADRAGAEFERLETEQQLIERTRQLEQEMAARLEAEQAIRRSEELNRRILECVPVGVLLVSKEGDIVKANEEAQRLIGYPEGVICKLRLDDFRDRTFFEDGRPCPPERSPVLQCLSNGETTQPQVLGIKHPKGHMVWCLISAVPYRDPQTKERAGAVITFLDLTERKRAEEERRKLEARMFHTQKLESLSVLTAGVAHDFNNLLTAVLGYAHLLEERVPADAEIVQMLKSIQSSAERAASLCRQMLAYAGKGRVTIRDVHLNDVVNDMLQLLKVSVPQNAVIRTRLRHDLPPISGDPTQISQVVMNLLTNAFEALTSESGTVTIETGTAIFDVRQQEAFDFGAGGSLTPGVEYVYLRVRDTGVGMDQQTVQRIFDPFYTTKELGRGLGLAAVHGIVRSHGGAVQVESAVGRGTAITVYLPVKGTQTDIPTRAN
ncbi:MAG: hypothetical protein KatS3mg105_2673 [Gemmatales bacterium]|nr:MAG: hypothetical protein KatS3mg105_2673 [Gemmatales bacterium]